MEGNYVKTHNHFECKEQNILKDMFGYNPIFAIPFDNLQDFLTTTLISRPNLPHYLVLFESDEYDSVDFLAWRVCEKNGRGIVKSATDKLPMKSPNQEYIVPTINKDSIVATLKVCDGDFETSYDNFNEVIFSTLADSIKDVLKGTEYEVTQDIIVKDLTETPANLAQRYIDYMTKVALNPKKVTQLDMMGYRKLTKDLLITLNSGEGAVNKS